MLEKFVFCLAVVAICFVRLGDAGKYELTPQLFESVKFDLSQKCANVEKDFENDFEKFRYKMLKEYAKMVKNAGKKDVRDCVESTRLEAETQLAGEEMDFKDCVRELKDSLENDFKFEAGLQGMIFFRNDFKNKLNLCKKKTKLNVKNIQNGFQTQGKKCLL